MEKIELNNKAILVTGAAGFIGSNLVKRLFNDAKGATIVGIDNMNDYYDVSLKEYRLSELRMKNEELRMSGNNWVFVKGDIADKPTVDGIFEQYKPQIGWRALQHHQSRCLHPVEPYWILQHSRGLPSPSRRASGLRFVVERLRHEQEGALLD